MAEQGLILPRTIPTSSWSLCEWGAAPSPPAPALGRAELLCGAAWGGGDLVLSPTPPLLPQDHHPCADLLQPADPRWAGWWCCEWGVRPGGPGGSLGGGIILASPAPSRRSGTFSSESQGTRTPGSCPWHQPAARSLCHGGPPGWRGGVCHGCVPKANHVPHANCPPRVNPVAKANHIPKLSTSQSPKTSPVRSASCVPKANHNLKPVMSPVPTMSPGPSTSLRLITSPGLLTAMDWGFPAQHVPFGPPHLCMGIGATCGTLGHCHVLPASPRDQPGHQIPVGSSPEEDHRGQNCGDQRWRGGKSSSMPPTLLPLHPCLPAGCPPRGMLVTQVGPPSLSPMSSLGREPGGSRAWWS